MNRRIFDNNLQLLSAKDPELCLRLSAAQTAPGRYTFLESRTGRVVPAIIDGAGQSHALHSTIDPQKEAQRLAATLNEGWSEPGFVVFLGLGAAYAAEAALNAGTASHILVIEFDINSVSGLFSSLIYSVLGDSRFTLLVDPDSGLIQKTILNLYNPSLYGGIRALPLRARVEQDKEKFALAGEAIQRAIEKVSADYSVQAHFGMRWFSNIIRNIGIAQSLNQNAPTGAPPQISVPLAAAAIVAICAAGPSLNAQIPLLRTRRESLFVIAADTSLPALLAGGVKPDAVVSIDCQHISYWHFIGTDSDCADIPLFLDIASPPLLSGFSHSPIYFAGGHPLAAYISQKWMPLPTLDTSGGNVTYACLSLAQQLGAHRITVYGADFSYPLGRPYARGTYFYPLFERQQNRLSPLEARVSSFLYRSPFLPPENEGSRSSVSPCYETGSLRFYRKSFEEKASAMEAEVSAEPGLGIPLELRRNSNKLFTSGGRIDFTPNNALTDSNKFLDQYKKDIKSLPIFGRDMNLNANERQVFTTLLPLLAAIKRRRPELAVCDLVEAAKEHCADEIERVLREWGVGSRE